MLLIEIKPGLFWLHRIMILTHLGVAGTNIVITTARLTRTPPSRDHLLS